MHIALVDAKVSTSARARATGGLRPGESKPPSELDELEQRDERGAYR